MNFSVIEIDKQDFELGGCKVFHYRNEENFRVNIFFLEASSHMINQNWKRFSNMVAANYQNSEYMGDSEFDRWNFYIIYISKDSVSKDLKNKIENDKFSSRKIVEDSYKKQFNDDEANRLIVEHITNTDLKEIVEKTQEVNVSEYIPKNENLWDLLLDEEQTIRERKNKEAFIQKINSI